MRLTFGCLCLIEQPFIKAYAGLTTPNNTKTGLIWIMRCVKQHNENLAESYR